MPVVEPKAKVAKSPKKKGSASPGKVTKREATPAKKGSPTKKKKAAKAGESDGGSKGVTVLSEKTLFLGQKVNILPSVLGLFILHVCL